MQVAVAYLCFSYLFFVNDLIGKHITPTSDSATILFFNHGPKLPVRRQSMLRDLKPSMPEAIKDQNNKKEHEKRPEKSLSASDIPNWQRTLGQRVPGSDPQYYVTAVIRVRLYKEDKAKWTIAELKQWLHYQFWAGAEHIYVCNHFLKRSERLEIPLKKYINLGLVTLIPWVHMWSAPGSKNYWSHNTRNQQACYNHVAFKYGNHSVWQYNFDMDENPYCAGDQSEGFLKRFLMDLSMNETGKGLNQTTVNIRLQNFLLHGQGDRRRDLVYDRINRITPEIANNNWKTIYRPGYVHISIHTVYHTSGKMLIADPRKLKILHYWGSRLQDWGPDTPELYNYTTEFNDVRNTIALSVRKSLLAFNETDAFSSRTGP